MKINFVGLVGCLLLGISVVAPWVTTHYYEINSDGRWEVFKEMRLYEIEIDVSWVEGIGWVKQPFLLIWAILSLLGAGIALGLIGSFKMHNYLLVCGGTSVFFSQILFGIISKTFHLSGYNWPPRALWFDVGYYMSFVGMVILYFSIFLTGNSRFTVTNQQQPAL